MAKSIQDSSTRIRAIANRLQDQLALGRTLEEAKLRFLELFDEAEIDSAIETLKAADNRFKDSKEIATLHSEPNYSGWYGGPNNDPSSVWSGLQRTLRNKSWSDEMVDNLDIASTGVIEQLSPPRSERPIRVKGLVLGYVQSGKTANYSAVIAKAVDAGYKLARPYRIYKMREFTKSIVRESEQETTDNLFDANEMI